MPATKLVHPSGKTITLAEDSPVVLVMLEAGTDAKKLHVALATTPYQLADEGTKLRVNHGHRSWWLRRRDGKPVRLDPKELTAVGLGVSWVAPVYRIDGVPGNQGLRAAEPNRLLVRVPKLGKLGDGKSAPPKLVEALKGAGFELATDFVPGRHLEVRGKAGADATLLHQKLGALFGDAVEVAVNWVQFLDFACATPPNANFANERSMQHLSMEQAWAPSGGPSATTVMICIVDKSGIALNHPDLSRASNWGYTQETANEGPAEGAPAGTTPADAHGTALAGIAAATWGANSIVGVAPACSIFAVKPKSPFGPQQYAACIDVAVTDVNMPTVPTKRVILLDGSIAVDNALTDAIGNAIAADCVVVVPAGNDLTGSATPGPVQYPATLAGVIAVGACDLAGTVGNEMPAADKQVINGSSPTEPGDPWSSCQGPELTLVAPGYAAGAGVLGILTTDLVGPAGYAPGDYFATFAGTSAAAAHVAGVAALVRCQDLALTQDKVRNRLLRTAKKINIFSTTNPNGYHYAADAEQNYRCDQTGYGLVDAYQALDFADVMVSDASFGFPPAQLDNGVEPSNTPAFWANGDVVIFDDAAHVVNDATYTGGNTATQISSSGSYGWVRVRNLGPQVARNVKVQFALNSVNTGFLFPHDWTETWGLNDPDRIATTPDDPVYQADGSAVKIPSLAVGATAIVRFRIDAAMASKALAWPSSHACGLVMVRADNDYAFAEYDTYMTAQATSAGGQQPLRNNLMQRNLHVVSANSPWRFTFKVGSKGDVSALANLTVDTRALPAGPPMTLKIVHPVSKPTLAASAPAGHVAIGRLELLEAARMHTQIGGLDGELRLAAGSRFDIHGAVGGPLVSVPSGHGAVTATAPSTSVVTAPHRLTELAIRKAAGEQVLVTLEIPVPPGFGPHDSADVDLVQRDASGKVLGGIRLHLVP